MASADGVDSETDDHSEETIRRDWTVEDIVEG